MTSQSLLPVPLPEERITALERAGGLIGLFGSVGALSLARWIQHRSPARLMIMAASLAGLAGVFWAFRNPRRRTTPTGDAILAPCDGTVQKISALQEGRFLRAPAQQVTIRISLGDAPVVRVPGRGAVQYRRLELATNPKAAKAGQSLWLGIRQTQGRRLLMQLTAHEVWRVVPAWLAQPITALVDLEDEVGRGQVAGHLALGGVVQLYLPVSARLVVAAGDRVRAGETLVAMISEA